MKAFCHVVTGEEMQRYDRNTMVELGIPALVLMEQAALAAVEEITRILPSGKEKILILAGKGNNGADGMAVARLLWDRGYPVTVYTLSPIEESKNKFMDHSDLPGLQYGILRRLTIPIVTDLPSGTYDMVVDAIFGVGLKRPVEDTAARVIEEVNRWRTYRLALDVPSGICSNTGKVLGCGFRADCTITFGFWKLGLCLYPGTEYSGRIVLGEIGINEVSFLGRSPVWRMLTGSPSRLLPLRPKWGHKGSFGKVLVIGGNETVGGAPYLAALGALRTGSGMVRIITHENQRQSLMSLLPEAFIDTDREENDISTLVGLGVDWADVIVFGPGVGTDERAKKLMKEVFEAQKLPLIIDADGLNLLSSTPLKNRLLQLQSEEATKRPLILTPHLLELARLANASVDQVRDRSCGILEQVSKEYGAVVVQKDARTLIMDESGKGCINLCGNSGMATAGSGDVLAGMIASLSGQGMEPFDAASIGVYLHGMAGDTAARRGNEYSLIATDIVQALKELLK